MRRGSRARGKATKERHALTIEEGMPAPGFELPDAEGKPVKLADFKGRVIVVYFYPKDDTPGCTSEAEDFTCIAADFEKAGTDVLGISTATASSGKSWPRRSSAGGRSP